MDIQCKTWVAWDTRLITSAGGASKPWKENGNLKAKNQLKSWRPTFSLQILVIRWCRSPVWRKVSSLQLLTTVPTLSVAPRMRFASSARLTPPIAATSLMSSSPAAEYALPAFLSRTTACLHVMSEPSKNMKPTVTWGALGCGRSVCCWPPAPPKRPGWGAGWRNTPTGRCCCWNIPFFYVQNTHCISFS